MRKIAEQIFLAGVEHVLPDRLIAQQVNREGSLLHIAGRTYPLSPDGRVYVLAAGKAAAAHERGLSLVDAYAHASRAMADDLARPDAIEGIDAFLTKRHPRWTTPGGDL